jgi:hypothetical protein
MAVGVELEAHSWRERAQALWAAFAKTAVGDIISTIVALSGVSLLFLACAYAIMAVAGVAEALFRYVR